MDVDIRTDVDRLLAALSGEPERMFTVIELATITGMSERSVKKWAHVLEANGKVKIVYKLTREHIVWAGGKTQEGGFRKKVEIDAAAAKDVSAPQNTPPVKPTFDYDSFSATRQADEEFRKRLKYNQLLEEKRQLVEKLGRLNDLKNEGEEEQAAAQKKQKNPEKAAKVAEKIAKRHFAKMREKAEEVGRLVEEKRKMEDELYAPLSLKAHVQLEKMGEGLLEHEERLLATRDAAHNSSGKEAKKLHAVERNEAGEVAKRLRMLKEASEKFGKELSQIRDKESRIEARISKSREELAALVGEGLRLSNLQHEELEEAYGKMGESGASRKKEKTHTKKIPNARKPNERKAIREFIRGKIGRRRNRA